MPAKQFIETSLAALATEHESTTFRYALAQVSTTAWHYTAPADRAEVVEHVAAELFKLAQAAEAGSDEQFQLITAYLGYGEPGDAAFEANAKGLLDGSVKLDGLEIDNNFRWTIINALSAINAIARVTSTRNSPSVKPLRTVSSHWVRVRSQALRKPRNGLGTRLCTTTS